MEHLATVLLESCKSLGYFGVFILMIMESSIIPVPSELVMIPVGVSAAMG
ncbi:MAG: hypothetical protein WCK88_06660 [bacterium]